MRQFGSGDNVVTGGDLNVSPARSVAFDVLRDVGQGGYASDLLRKRFVRLKAADAALASELVFGVLRYRPQLDYLITHYSGRGPERLDQEVRLALALGIHQLRYLDRIPRHAAVSQSVELVKRARKRSAAGLVNAVLRKVNRDPGEWPNRAVELAAPEWLLAGWERMFGPAGVRMVASALLSVPETYIRVPGQAPPEALRTEPTGVPGCYRLLGGEPNGFRRQDISSQAIVPLLELEPGQRFLDLCAAPGNKTAQALETPILAIACDRSRPRLAGLAPLGVPLVQVDATLPLPFARGFDRILVDAPCSGTGTIGRNPEIKWRIQPSDLERHHQRQVRLLGNALRQLASGGRLVYSTCSLEYEENEQVVEETLFSQPPEFVLAHQIRRIPGADLGDGFYAAVILRV